MTRFHQCVLASAMLLGACKVAIPGELRSTSTTWSQLSIGDQRGLFRLEFDVTPSAAAMDGVVGVGSGQVAAYADLSAIVRLAPDGFFDARDGGAYARAATVRYAAGSTYRVRLDIDVIAQRYDASVTPPGAAPVRIATGFAFRRSNKSLTALAAYAERGSHVVRNVTVEVGDGLTDPAPEPPMADGGGAEDAGDPAPTPPAPGTLEWPRPNTAGYTRIAAPADGKTRLAAGVDYVIEMPNHALPRLNIVGGRNVVVIGGKIDVSHRPANVTEVALARENRAMLIQGSTGHVYIEGLEITGDWLFEGINISLDDQDAPNARVTMQRIRVSKPVLAVRSDAGHSGGDLLQSWAIPAKGLYLADWTVGRDNGGEGGVTYQGFFLQTLGNQPHPVVMKRIELHHTDPDQWVLDRIERAFPADAEDFFNPGTFKYWAASGVSSMTLEDCYLHYPEPAATAWGRPWSQVSSSMNGASQVAGAVVRGAPSAAFVPAGSVGLGYR